MKDIKDTAKELITLQMLKRQGFALKAPLNKRNLMVLRYVYLTIVFLISWLSIEAEHFLLKLWVAAISPWINIDIMLFDIIVFTFGLVVGALSIIVIIAKVVTAVVSPINETMEKIWGTMDEYAKKVISNLPVYIRVPLFVYYFFTFDIDKVVVFTTARSR